MQQRLFIVGAKRTPFGAFGGKLKGLTATDLAVKATAAALSAAKVNPAAVDSVCIGNVQQTSPDAAYLARHVALKCDMATETPALNINRLCGSGFQSVVNIAHEILVGEAQICADTYVPGLPLYVRVARTSLLRAVRTGGAGQLAPWGGSTVPGTRVVARPSMLYPVRATPNCPRTTPNYPEPRGAPTTGEDRRRRRDREHESGADGGVRAGRALRHGARQEP